MPCVNLKVAAVNEDKKHAIFVSPTQSSVGIKPFFAPGKRLPVDIIEDALACR